MIGVVLFELSNEYEIEKVNLVDKTMNPCCACFACAGKKNCVWKDDYFCEFYDNCEMGPKDVLLRNYFKVIKIILKEGAGEVMV